MLARAFALIGKGCKRPLNLSVQASTSPGRRFDMSQQLRQLHGRSAQPENSPEEQHHLQNNSGGTPSRLACISEQIWSTEHNNITTNNSADAAADSIRDTVEGSFDQRISTFKSIGEERIDERELKLLLKRKPAPISYVWCDLSPWMHISQGIIKTICVNKMVKSGCKVKILMADWFAQMNDEIGGNINKMQAIGLYNIEMWKAAGMALDKVELVWLSDEISRRSDEYWPLVMDVARNNTVRRIKRCHGIRDPFEQLTADDIFYPCLQCAIILFQKVDIWLFDMNHHEANLLAREYCKRVKRENKPIAVLHNMLPNLLQIPARLHRKHSGQAIFMEDDELDICKKIGKAFCPPKLAEGNPCLEYIKYIILPWFGKFEVVRKKEDGGNKMFRSMEELTADYVSGALHPIDMKLALAKSLNKMLQPVRDHFRSSAEAKHAVEGIKELRC